MAGFSLRFLTQNTGLIKLRYRTRPQEWGRYIDNNFDVVCLQEVWQKRHLRRLRDQIRPEPRTRSRTCTPGRPALGRRVGRRSERPRLR